ncbi:MAG: tRNA-dihydrouridine synthase family protein [Lachnospiraceae bacterium]|nr:tRNA-dihydrouridine synthase family protein [Lachnospiraceae bacterium]
MEIKPLKMGGFYLPNNVLMAPLAGYTCYPFRLLCQEMGAGVSFTEMVSANGLKYKDKATKRLLLTTKDEKIKAVQLLGGNPSVMERAACSEELSGFDIIDINMGCPVPNIFKSGEGSALLMDLKRASKIIRQCKRSGKPVSVKCRIGVGEKHHIAAEFAKMCEDSGADMISIHGRTRNMMYDGAPVYEQIAEAKAVVQIPVIANGGIFSVADADKMMQETGADGVMIGRYGLEHPYIFAELTGKVVTKGKGQILKEQSKLAFAYYDEVYAIDYIRKLAAYFMKKQPGMKGYKQKMYQCGTWEELSELFAQAFS